MLKACEKQPQVVTGLVTWVHLCVKYVASTGINMFACICKSVRDSSQLKPKMIFKERSIEAQVERLEDIANRVHRTRRMEDD